MASDAMPADEPQRRAAAVNELLREIGSGAIDETTWWNHHAYDELGGRTPTQTWLAGDTETVTALIDHWYASSEAAAERAASDPAFLDLLRTEIARLDERVANR